MPLIGGHWWSDCQWEKLVNKVEKMGMRFLQFISSMFLSPGVPRHLLGENWVCYFYFCGSQSLKKDINITRRCRFSFTLLARGERYVNKHIQHLIWSFKKWNICPKYVASWHLINCKITNTKRSSLDHITLVRPRMSNLGNIKTCKHGWLGNSQFLKLPRLDTSS